MKTYTFICYDKYPKTVKNITSLKRDFLRYQILLNS